MKQKITFEVEIADGFTHPPKEAGTNLHLWPVAVGKSKVIDVYLEFEPSSGDNMKDAESALDAYMKRKYKGKQYKIFYWWWKK